MAKKKKKKSFNMYEAMHKHKKKVVLTVCSILVVALLAGVFAQFAYM